MMSNQSALERLRAAVPSENLITNSAGAIAFSTALGIHSEIPPLAVVLPETVEQAAHVMAAAHDGGFALVIRGAGSDLGRPSTLQANRTQSRNRVVFSTSKLQRILDVDVLSRAIHVQGGASLAAVRRAIAPHDLTIGGSDHGAGSIATLGGTLANAAVSPSTLGSRSLTTDVLGLTLVMPNGQIVRVGGAVPDSPVMALPALMTSVSRAGALIAEAWIALRPAPPMQRELTAFWSDWSRATIATREISTRSREVQSAIVCDAILVAEAGPKLNTASVDRGSKLRGGTGYVAATVMAVAGHRDDVEEISSDLERALLSSGASDLHQTDMQSRDTGLLQTAHVNRAFYLSGQAGAQRLLLDAAISPPLVEDCNSLVRELAVQHGADVRSLCNVREGLLLFAFDCRGANDKAADPSSLFAAVVERVTDLGGIVATLHSRKRYGGDVSDLLQSGQQSTLDADALRALLQVRRGLTLPAAASARLGDAEGRSA